MVDGVDLVPGVLALRLVHRDVGVLQQHVDVVPVLRVEGDADARVDVNRQLVDDEVVIERGANLLGRIGGSARVPEAGKQDAELVSAEARDRVAVTQRRAQALADVLEQVVALLVAEGVVDLLEAVEVDQQHGADTRSRRPCRSACSIGRGTESGSAGR